MRDLIVTAHVLNHMYEAFLEHKESIIVKKRSKSKRKEKGERKKEKEKYGLMY